MICLPYILIVPTMSSSLSFSILPTATPTSLQSPSGSTSRSSSTSITMSVTYSFTPMLTPSSYISASVSEYTTMSPTSLWSPVSQTPTPTAFQTATASPTPTKAAQQQQQVVNLGLTVGEMTIIFTVLGILILIGIINTIHYNNKYKAEKMKRLTEIRNNPLHSQVRNILPV